MKRDSIVVAASLILITLSASLTCAFDQVSLERLRSGGHCARCDLRHAPLAGSNLSGADLSSSDCSAANLSSANLSGANLSGANLSGAILTGADLSGANLSEANMSGAIWSDGTTRCSYRSVGSCTR